MLIIKDMADFIAISTNTLFIVLASTYFIRLVCMVRPNLTISWHLNIMLYLILSLISLSLPIYSNYTLVQIIRGVIGDLSISGLLTLIIMLMNYLTSTSNGIRDLFPRSFCALTVSIGLILYLSTLGFIPFDVYGLGYKPGLFFLIIIFLLQLVFWKLNRMFAIIWLIALIAYYYKLQNSINLWDYLLDPIIWLLSICGLFNSRPSKK